MSRNNSILIGSVVERKPTAPRPLHHQTTSKTGFPAVQHRSKSAFSRSREEARKTQSSRLTDVPPTIQILPLVPPKEHLDQDDNQWRDQISRENQRIVANMTDEEREEEKREILQRFGANIEEVLYRARQSREKQKVKENDRSRESSQDVPKEKVTLSLPSLQEVPITRLETQIDRKFPDRVRSPPPSAMSTPTRPLSRADRKIRFAELSPADVHVYESAPPSPHPKVLALPPPPGDGSAISLGTWKGKLPEQLPPRQPDQTHMKATAPEDEPEEGSAEYIRRRYFPDAPRNDPNIAWMHSSLPVAETTSSLRFDLQGNPISEQLSSTLPTHLGLHHHAEGAHAGYTLDDVFLLSRSTVPAQRATMLGVLAHIANKISKLGVHPIDGMEGFIGKEEEWRKRFIAAGVEAMAERGTVGAKAVELLWECVVGWSDDVAGIEGIELGVQTGSAIDSLPVDFILPQINNMLSIADGVPRGLLLSILYRFSKYSNEFSKEITITPKLITNILQTFLLTPIPPTGDSALPDPLALDLLITLAISSRSNAKELEQVADALLRFMTFIPSDSPFPTPLATSLLVSTLRFYTVLASYGLYSHVASTARTQIAQLRDYINSLACTSRQLKVAWANLLEAWIVCAIDPHKTTPEHDITWSQINGFGWNEDILGLQEHIGDDPDGWIVWAASWRVQAAWLEGSKINGERGGESERRVFLENVQSSFESGVAKQVVNGVIEKLQQEQASSFKITRGENDAALPKRLRDLASHADVLTVVTRLWLSCIPNNHTGPPPTPPFSLPFPKISELCARLLTHPIWELTSVKSSSNDIVSCRQLSGLLSFYLKLSRRLPGISNDLWMAQAFSILLRLMPGDEGSALEIVEQLTAQVTPEWAAARNLRLPSAVWTSGRLSILGPFITGTIQSQDLIIAPLHITPRSISDTMTQRLPALPALRKYGLPLQTDWIFTPMDHLLHSADSSVFKALPTSWDASEAEVTKASLLLANVSRDLLKKPPLNQFALTSAQAVFGCMQIYMLEHGQPQNDSAEEVFRDAVVGELLEKLLQPYTAGAIGTSVAPRDQNDLEKVATRFLGASVPFFQYYTDFIALYDSISFSQPLFARLTLPATSMRYPLDYRKHLYCDFQHVLRTIRTPITQVISGDLREFLYPIETDAQMIGSYLRSLLQDSIQEFVRFVALHHLASNIWPDLQQQNEAHDEERAAKLLKAVADQGGFEVIKQVVQYRQSKSGSLLFPPDCFIGLQDCSPTRLECLYRWGGEALVNRLQPLLT